jgi:hypothetical protein
METGPSSVAITAEGGQDACPTFHDSCSHGAIKSQNTYAEKLTVMFSEEGVVEQCNRIENPLKSGPANRRKFQKL